MNYLNSLTTFFYNIVPGFIFLLFNSFYYKTQLFENTNIDILQVVIVSVLLGFVFQSFTKKFRDAYLNKKILDEIGENDKSLLSDADKILESIPCTKNKEKDRTEKNIYLMHNFLIAKYGAVVFPEFFSERLALWSNMMFASLITVILIFIMPFYNLSPEPFSGSILLDLFLLILFTYHSYGITKKYQYALYDSIVRTFVSVQSLASKPLGDTVK